MPSTSDLKPFTFQKQPLEKEIISVDFSRRIPAGVTIAAQTVVSELWNNSPELIANMTGTLLQVSGIAVVRKVLSCMITDGSGGYNYRVTFTVTLSDGQVKEDEVFVTVKED